MGALASAGSQSLPGLLGEIGTLVDDWLDRPLPAKGAMDAFGRGVLSGLGAFYLGYYAGAILFPAGTSHYIIDNPGNWTEYLCNSPPAGIFVGPEATMFPSVPGTSPANCISGQFISYTPPPPIWAAYWVFYWPYAPNCHSHVATLKYEFAVGQTLDPPTVRRAQPAIAGAWAPPKSRAGAPPLGVPVGNPWPGAAASAGSGAGFAPPFPPQPIAGPRPTVAGSVGGFGPRSNSTTGVNVGVGGVTQTTAPRHAPPPKGTKEIKGRTATPMRRAVMAAAGLVTEGMDLTMCANQALPGKLRAKPVWINGVQPPGNVMQRERPKVRDDVDTRKRTPLKPGYNWRWTPGKGWHQAKGYYRAPTMGETGKAIYRNANHIDIEKFAICFIENAIEDHILGGIGRVAAQASRNRGGPVGYQTGPVF